MNFPHDQTASPGQERVAACDFMEGKSQVRDVPSRAPPPGAEWTTVVYRKSGVRAGSQRVRAGAQRSHTGPSQRTNPKIPRSI